jgi:hypothetical protein
MVLAPTTKGTGTILSFGDTAEALTPIAVVTEVTPNDRSINSEECTPLTAAAVERAFGIPDNGPLKGNANYNPSDAEVFEEIFATAAVKYWALDYPTDPVTRHLFQGCLTKFSPGAITAKTPAMTSSFEIESTGPLTISEVEEE